MLLRGPGDGVVLAIGLQRAGAHPVGVEVRAPVAPDVDRPEVVGRLAAMDPLGDRLPGAPAGGDAEGVEPGADAEFRQRSEERRVGPESVSTYISRWTRLYSK